MSLSIKLTVLPGGKLPPLADILAEIRQTQIDVGNIGEEMLLEPTEHWQDKPEFTKRFERPDLYTVLTMHKKYVWTDRGTKRHWIFPRKPGGRLVFFGAFTAKTSPGSLKGGPGASGPPKVFAEGVDHPGTEPRKFSAVAQEEVNRILARQLRIRLAKLIRGRRW